MSALHTVATLTMPAISTDCWETSTVRQSCASMPTSKPSPTSSPLATKHSTKNGSSSSPPITVTSMKAAMAVLLHVKENPGSSHGLLMVTHQTGTKNYAPKKSFRSSCVNAKLSARSTSSALPKQNLKLHLNASSKLT